MENKLAVGIDIGGTSLKGIILSSDGRSSDFTRMPTEAAQGGHKVLENLLKLIGIMLEKSGDLAAVLGIGIGTPGFIDSAGVAGGGSENLPGWRGTPIFQEVQKKYNLPVTGGNDVTLATLAELKYGVGKGIPNFVYFALGTGIGGGIVINGKLYRGSHGMAGELGHISVDPEGLPCNCGQRGCVEQYASGTGIVNLALSMSAKNNRESPFSKLVKQNPGAVTAELVYHYVAADDPVALIVHHRASRMLARALGITVNVLSPDMIVLGGGVMKSGKLIIETVDQYVPEYCFPEIYRHCTIAKAKVGENGGALGAAIRVFDEFSSLEFP